MDSEGRTIFEVEFLVGMTKYGLQPHLGKTIRRTIQGDQVKVRFKPGKEE